MKALSGFKMLTLVLIAATAIAGCSSDSKPSSSPSGSNSPNETSGTAGEKQEVPYVEVWKENFSTIDVNEKSKISKYIAEQSGIGVIHPSIPWEGGSAYIQRLNTRIASGDLPDLFLPWQGNENTLITQGAVADLTDMLPKYAPHLWESVPEEVWDVVRTADPSGKGRIYYVPLVNTYTFYGSFIRKDWLDRVGMEVPKTQEEYVEVLRAFRDQDANGNGDPNDELPVSGREFGRWMDHLFGMYGIAMWEGFPMWDIYDGELTYSAVTPNMKDAIAFIRDLYAEKLLDQNTFLNQGSDWVSAIDGDKLGSWFHINTTLINRTKKIATVNPEVEVAALGIPKVDGYDGFITNTQLNRPNWLIANKDEETVIHALELLDWMENPDNVEKIVLGLEGVHYELVDGKPVFLQVDAATTEPKVMARAVNNLSSIQLENEIQLNAADPESARLYENRDQVLLDAQKYGKTIAGDGIPASVYEGYPDIRNHTLYQEYMTKIIIGELDISAFDEFVDKWYQSGGQAVTEAARAWYADLSK
ncbi:extracellular solute-binding protein [Paenibacillus sp. J5C_2022]|uniref:extracellular solute-binding protein n=1 Tax=Paenibacillus sp. J5C2022 TaxID=2977129 RepID=UPI0021CE3F54|nr:extracellular solute-binding protein [Paenibacillus sp. J5C2022]MCU6712121.1 extracellular solute-binding protein [Paenibacillus sp. J5C2022]